MLGGGPGFPCLQLRITAPVVTQASSERGRQKARRGPGSEPAGAQSCWLFGEMTKPELGLNASPTLLLWAEPTFSH